MNRLLISRLIALVALLENGVARGCEHAYLIGDPAESLVHGEVRK